MPTNVLESSALADLREAIVPSNAALINETETCYAAEWRESNINRVLGTLFPSIAETGGSVSNNVVFQIIGNPIDEVIDEIRLEWGPSGDQNLALPGFTISAQAGAVFNIVITNDNASLLVTLQHDSTLEASSSFAWIRDAVFRELQNDPDGPAEKPFFNLSLTNNSGESHTIAIVDLPTSGQLEAPAIFKKYEALAPLNMTTACSPVELSPNDWTVEDKDRWTIDLAVNVEEDFKFPFLNQAGKDTDDGSQEDPVFDQFVEIIGLETSDIVPDFATCTIPLTFSVRVTFGEIKLVATIDLTFNWKAFAFNVEHELGIDLISEKAQLPDPAVSSSEHLGLTWRFVGSEITDSDDPHHGEFRYLTLATNFSNYQLQQAEGAVFEIDYTKASKEGEPITFSISDFALTPKGISLAAVVTDRPARLNGIDTRFRFNGSGLTIVENRIKDFTIAGSGPLPPDLVGPAMVDIALQFAQQNGSLTLVAGGARLSKDKLLEAKNTRFQFQIDAIGLKFVNEGRFHLYFTLTGKANFVLAPSDDRDGALALLPNIQIDLIDCPLTGDASVVAKHVKFLIELPKPLSFSFLGAFEFELRAIGFVPQAEQFDGDAAMQLSGQIKFAQGAGDVANAAVDFHGLFIGVPARGSFVPRISLKGLGVSISYGDAFKLEGVVDFVDDLQEKGFSGEGTLEIQGLPTIAASFAFLRVRRDIASPWVRAWFVFLEVRQVSFPIPYVQLYLREVGLGFGYRYTLASIKTADRANDLGQLLESLRTLSRTQGDLSKRDRWEVDLEEPGQDLRWTVVLRALISQASASPSPLKWNPKAEKNLPCPILFDAVIAFRSDLTFFMAMRAWLNTNYHDFVDDRDLSETPLLSGFVLLSPKQKRFLAQASSNPNGKVGTHPPVPPYVNRAIQNSQFSMTLLVEPGLFHYEMGWPNMLTWGDSLGPIKAEFRGGFIFRVSKNELVTGTSFVARGKLTISSKFEFGIVGVRLSATASVAYGARYIGVIDYDEPERDSAIYGAIGLEVRIRFSVEFWVRIELVFTRITIRVRFSLSVGFTAGLEIGLDGLPPSIGVRGSGTVSVRALGRSVRLNVRLGTNEGAVRAALGKTQKFLNIGLEATDVKPVPGVANGGAPSAAASRSVASGAAASMTAASPAAETIDLPSTSASTLDATTAPEALHSFITPNYYLFVVESHDGFRYFVLIPQGEREDQDQNGFLVAERGFLPVPPADGLEPNNDFEMTFPALASGAAATVERYDGDAGEGADDGWVETQLSDTATSVAWTVHWDSTDVMEAEFVDFEAEPGEAGSDPDNPSESTEFDLKSYMRNAFLTEDGLPIGDPEFTDEDLSALEDERVHNPTDDSFEAAVRGAIEQFRGSPFFKRDPDNAYDAALSRAFDDRTSIYTDDEQPLDEADLDDPKLKQRQISEQADQLRGMVVHDLIADVQEYANETNEAKRQTLADQSIAFQMGIVFRTKSPDLAWLDSIPDESGQIPTIRQRLGPDAENPSDEVGLVRTFNLPSISFANLSPQFQRVQQYTDANTIAVAWDLTWERVPDGLCTMCQGDPEHHLMHYQVRRRALDGAEPTSVYTVKNADGLVRETTQTGSNVLKRIKSRFQLVDHFTDETDEDRDGLPINGRTYLYTITPVDFSGKLGRPLSLIATRRPSDPPLVPVDAVVTVRYRLDESVLAPENEAAPRDPIIVAPNRIRVTWSDPMTAAGRRVIPVKRYVVIFRKERTVPIGSYGLDGSTQGPGTKSLPTSNARPLPTDIKIVLEAEGSREEHHADISIDTLQSAGVLPGGEEPRWRPDSWMVFIQAVSIQEVPSALAPVQLLLQVERTTTVDDTDEPLDRREERKPAQLEWMAQPVEFPFLQPEDERVVTGLAHFPMPSLTNNGLVFTGTITGGQVDFREHPAGIRAIRMRWNQGPSGRPGYPLDLHAGYHLFELDVDSHTTETFQDPERLSRAIRQIQEVQMLVAEDLPLTPGDTLSTNRWEAWYASTLIRQRQPGATEGSQSPFGPWFSWRESILVWPQWPGEVNGDFVRDQALHPILQAIVDDLETPNTDGGPSYVADVQISPPIQPSDLASFMSATASKTDPYGWGILQRLGLSTALSLRDASTGKLVDGAVTLQVIHNAIGTAVAEASKAFLHVEALFQPGKSIELSEKNADNEALLATVQLSLRPTIAQRLLYNVARIEGTSEKLLELVFSFTEESPCSIVIRTESSDTRIEFVPVANEGASAEKAFQHKMTVRVIGQADLLIRCIEVPIIEDVSGDAVALSPLAVTDERTTNFTTPDSLATDFSAKIGTGDIADPALQWRRFKSYVQSTNSNDPDVPAEDRITIPSTTSDIEAFLPEFLPWAQRFFNASGDVDEQVDGRSAVERGPWLATAYPRVSTPAYATPDATGRLKYDHLLEDKWAHNYRYYIRPYGRYDLLWQSFRQSPSLFQSDETAAGKAPDVVPDPEAGGLDVVLHRTHPVDKPLVLRSGRLDPPTKPGRSAPPGAIWEVMVAQHPEQALIERNQTLFRRLAFRQVAFTMLRRLAVGTWPDDLEGIVNSFGQETDFAIELKQVEDSYPSELPQYPESPEHIDLTEPLSVDESTSLDVPLRMGTFQQGAMVLQWEKLPFFYEHRLLLVAQSDSVVSAVNEVTERDFEYRSPTPTATMEGAILSDWQSIEPYGDGDATVELGVRRVHIPLERFWDCLPEGAQEQWSAEAPLDTVFVPAGLPDPEVVYQLVVEFAGNLEVQSELFYDAVTSGNYAVLRLAEPFVTEIERVDPPPPATAGDFVLRINVLDVTEKSLNRTYNEEDIAAPTRQKITFDGNVISTVGVFTAHDRDNILFTSVPERVLDRREPNETVREFLDQWYSTRTITDVVAIPVDLQDKVDYPDLPSESNVAPALRGKLQIDGLTLMWTGPINAQEEAALAEFGDTWPGLREGIDLLIKELKPEAPEDVLFSADYDVAANNWPPPEDERPVTLSLGMDTNGSRTLAWVGTLNDADRESLEKLRDDPAYDSAFSQGLDALIRPYDEQPFSLDIGDGTTGSQNGLSVENRTDQNGDPIRRLSWKGQMLGDPVFTADEDDDAFEQGIEELKNEIGQFFNSGISVTIAPPPRKEIESLRRLMKTELDGLTIPSDPTEPVAWVGLDNLVLTPTELKDRLRKCLEEDDAFIGTFSNLMDQIDEESRAIELTAPLIRCVQPLTRSEADDLQARFGKAEDKDTIEQLFEDLNDRELLDGMVGEWFTQEPVSQRLTVDVDNLDFPDPTHCVLAWTGDTVPSDVAEISGDQEFLNAFSQLRALSAEDGSPSVSLAPLGPDQIPHAVVDNMSFNVAGSQYDSLTWTGLLMDDHKAVLQRWAQIEEFNAAVTNLLDELDTKVTTAQVTFRPSSATVPDTLNGKLQIAATQIGWLGGSITPDERDELDSLIARQGLHSQSETDLEILRAAIDENGASGENVLRDCVVVVPSSNATPRPTADQLPDILKEQLTIEEDLITWTGRVHSQAQLVALQSLSGDEDFTNAVANIISQLNASTEIPFTLPVRTHETSLPESLRVDLLIGRAIARYHGVMPTVVASSILDGIPADATPDRAAVERLYHASVNVRLNGSELQVRARRGTATPSDRILIEPRGISLEPNNIEE